MLNKVEQFLNMGMNRDLSISKAENKFAFENFNIRITENEKNSLLSVTNEKGNRRIGDFYIPGCVLGYCVVNKYAVIFTTEGEGFDHIYRIDYLNKDQFRRVTIFNGNLNFSKDRGIETLGVYEKDDVVKVYWLDGVNQPRVVNITGNIDIKNGEFVLSATYGGKRTQFDFVMEIEFADSCKITKDYDIHGQWPSGVIQYFFTYSKRYGQESSIFWSSQLFQLTREDKGASENDIVNCGFRIGITYPDPSFDFVNIYRVIRTSLNGIAQAKFVTQIAIVKSSGSSTPSAQPIDYVDDNTKGSAIEPSELLYKGGENITASTMAQKDNTLFLGDITTNRVLLSKEAREKIRSAVTVGKSMRTIDKPDNGITGLFPFNPHTKGLNNAYFKGGNWYRLGIQFQDIYGKWSDPVWVGDYKMMTTEGKLDNNGNDEPHPTDEFTVPTFYYSLDPESLRNITVVDTGNDVSFLEEYKRCRAVVVYPEASQRNVAWQGIVCPTVAQMNERFNNQPYARSSWFFRAEGDDIEYKHARMLRPNGVDSSEISSQDNCVIKEDSEGVEYRYYFSMPTNEVSAENNDSFFVDRNTVTINSPDINETDKSSTNFDFAIVGRAPLVTSSGKYVIEADTQSVIGGNVGAVNDSVINTEASGIMTRIAGWADVPISKNDGTILWDTIYTKKGARLRFAVYPWQRSGSLSNAYRYPDSTVLYSQLKHKLLSNIRYSNETLYDVYWGKGHDEGYKGITNCKIYDKDDTSTEYLFLDRPENPDDKIKQFVNRAYTGSCNTTVSPSGRSTYIYTTSGIYPNGELVKPSLSFSEGEFTAILPSTAFLYPLKNYDVNQFIGGITIADNLVYSDEDRDTDIFKAKNGTLVTNSPVQIKYKSTTHAVFSFNNESSEYSTNLPHLLEEDVDLMASDNDLFWVKYKIAKDVGAVEPMNEKVVMQSDFDRMLKFFKGDKTSTGNWASGCLFFVTSGLRIGFDYLNNVLLRVVGYVRDNQNMLENALDPSQYDFAWYGSNNETCYFQVVPEIQYDNLIRINELREYMGTYKFVKSGDIKVVTSTITGQAKQVLVSQGSLVKIADAGEEVHHNIIKTDSLGVTHDTRSQLIIGEIYRNTDASVFADINNEEAASQETWSVASESMNISDLSWKSLVLNDGDTYYQRWDCLKTYPYTEDDTNSIVEVASVMIESYKNLDGRYDNNRGATFGTYLRPTNMNLFNDVYNQKNNFFSFHSLPLSRYSTNRFVNQFMASLTKSYGELTDSWTSLTAASTFDVDSAKGKINAIRKFNDTLYGFQDEAIFQILFNPMTQIATTSGQPIEITNSGKVNGVRYMTGNQGCINKWSIKETPMGLYFIDDLNASINVMGGNGIKSISSQNGFAKWMLDNRQTDEWRPGDFNNEITHYDRNKDDVYFTFKDISLVWSEKLGQFTSFMSYENVPAMFNIVDNFVSLKNDMMWLQNDGKYNCFFGEYKPYYIEYRINPDSMLDKTFNNIEYIASMTDIDKYDANKPAESDVRESFDKLYVWNDYQRGEADLTRREMPPFDLQRKFRIWRANIPRDMNDPRKLNRIRSPWIHLRLIKDNVSENNPYIMEFHNLLVRYSE